MILSNKIFYIEGNLYEDKLFIDKFQINPNYRGKHMSYFIWNFLLNRYKVDIHLLAFFTLKSYYLKMGFKDLGIADDEGYHEFVLKY